MKNDKELWELAKKGTEDCKAVKKHMKEIVKIWRDAPCSQTQRIAAHRISCAYMEHLLALNDDDFQDEMEDV